MIPVILALGLGQFDKTDWLIDGLLENTMKEFATNDAYCDPFGHTARVTVRFWSSAMLTERPPRISTSITIVIDHFHWPATIFMRL